MKYIQRLFEKNQGFPLGPTYKNNENPSGNGLHAVNKRTEKSVDSPWDLPTETTKTLSVVSVGDQHGESPKFSWPPRPAELASCPVEWRERWGRLANELQDQGVPWPDHERQAFDQVKAEMEAT